MIPLDALLHLLILIATFFHVIFEFNTSGYSSQKNSNRKYFVLYLNVLRAQVGRVE